MEKFRDWLIAKAVTAIFAVLRLVPADAALDFADRFARRFGPWTGRHRVALANLRAAYPDKGEAEINAIALDMWANMARLFVEYVFLDRLFDFDPDAPEPGRIEVGGIDTFLDVRSHDKPRIFFTAHTGNFEMFPIAASRFGLEVHALFRAPNNPYLASELGQLRDMTESPMVASRRGAALALASILEKGGNIGALVDQKFNGGMRTTFFGRDCLTSPLAPRLARQFDADIHGARCIRLPGNRYRLELLPRIEPARDADGRIDAHALAQQMNDIIEGWVREHPGQWMWFHKRWEIRQRGRKKR